MPFRADSSRLSSSAESAELIVCEPTGRWAAALRGWESIDAPIHETRSVAECWEALGRAPGSFVVVEATEGNFGSLVGRLGRLEREFPLARVAAVAERRLGGYEWLLREAGAVHFASSTRRLEPLVNVIRRHFNQTPEPRRGLAERIWAALPWAETRR